MRIFLLALILLANLTSGRIWAAEVTGLYEATINVADQGERERKSAIKKAFVETVIKLTGDDLAPDHPLMRKRQARSDKYISRYSYKTTASDQGAGDQQQIIVSFDKKALDNVIHQAGLTTWGRIRPATLVWLVADTPEGRFIVNNDRGISLRDALQSEADRRGLPVLFPLMDLEDQRKIHFVDLWGNFKDNIVSVSDRYGAEAILLGRLHKAEFQGWRTRWTLYQGDKAKHWISDDTGLEGIIYAGIDNTVSELFRQFSANDTRVISGSVLIMVKGVNHVSDYTRVVDYLQGLDAIKSVQVTQIFSNSAQFSLTSRSSQSGLAKLISLGSTLKAQKVQVNDEGTSTPRLMFSLLP